MPVKKYIVEVGERYGLLVMIRCLGPNGRSREVWVAQCDCGEFTLVETHNICKRVEPTQSCGCLKRKAIQKQQRATVTHGMSSTRVYEIWHGMIYRCHNVQPGRRDYANWRGRGITVCERWRSNFLAFLEDMGMPEDGQTLDRRDNDGNYEPGNCRWTDKYTQSVNRRGLRFITFQGETHNVTQWARKLGMRESVLFYRLKRYGEVRGMELSQQYPGQRLPADEWIADGYWGARQQHKPLKTLKR